MLVPPIITASLVADFMMIKAAKEAQCVCLWSQLTETNTGIQLLSCIIKERRFSWT
jgi:hypothetical protein